MNTRSILFVLLLLFTSLPRLVSATSATLLTPVSITATGGGQDLDIAPYTGKLRVHLTSLNTAGTSPTLACKLQGTSAATVGPRDAVGVEQVGEADQPLVAAQFAVDGGERRQVYQDVTTQRHGIACQKKGEIHARMQACRS